MIDWLMKGLPMIYIGVVLYHYIGLEWQLLIQVMALSVLSAIASVFKEGA